MAPRRHQSKPVQTRSRATRSSRGRALLSDPAQNTASLNAVLRSLGLYAADILGDGNCLFRALSDQLYGSPSRHVEVRRHVCDWIEKHAEQYQGFVEDERGIAVHLCNMRELGTYGGHLEISAFAHLHRRNVKVIQPGLVYIIEWAIGTPAEASTSKVVSRSSSMSMSTSQDLSNDKGQSHKGKRRTRRDVLRAKEMLEEEEVEAVVAAERYDDDHDEDESEDKDPSIGAIYIAYHDWEHFSSIRNLRGPHSGVPDVRETPAPVADPISETPPNPKIKIKLSKQHQQRLLTPNQVPLPPSRPDSPHPTNIDGVAVIPPTPVIPSVNQELKQVHDSLRVHRSPKRSFDESSGSSAEVDEVRRTRSRLRAISITPDTSKIPTNQFNVAIDGDSELSEEEEDESTPSLSLPSSRSLSTPSPPSTPPPFPDVQSSYPPENLTPKTPMLTRRQRKALGLPKLRTVSVTGGATAASSITTARRKIMIPGGKYNKSASATGSADAAGDEVEGEWKTNGAGRLDVRGFRELRI